MEDRLIQLEGRQNILVRPIRPSDAELEKEFVRNLSAQSRRFRFLCAKRELSPRTLKEFTTIDESRNMALVAIARKEQDHSEKEVAVARYMRNGATTECDFAVVVDDAYQGLGLGKQLMLVLIEDAKKKGYTKMNGTISAQNDKMIGLAKKLGFKVFRDPEDFSLARAELVLRDNL